MKNKFVLILFAVLLFSFSAQASKVYITDSRGQADLIVTQVESKAQANLVIYITDSQAQAATHSNYWYFTDSMGQADIIVYFTESSNATKVYFTNSKSQTKSGYKYQESYIPRDWIIHNYKVERPANT